MASAAVIAAVKARISAEVLPRIQVTFRDLDSPTILERPKSGGPYLEVEFWGGSSSPEEFGSPDSNNWTERGTIQFHIFVDHKATMDSARAIWTVIFSQFVGRLFDGVFVEDVTAQADEIDPAGAFKGLSASVSYSFEFTHA